MSPQALLSMADVSVVSLAWVLVFAWLFSHGFGLLVRSVRDRVWIAVVFVCALGLRLSLPWGVANFVDAERLTQLWARDPELSLPFVSMPVFLASLRSLGLSTETLLRLVPQVFGALSVVAVGLAARSFRLGRGAAIVSALALCAWPAHLHFSTAPTFSVEGMAFWLFAFALAGERGEGVAWREALLAALTVLGVYARPEYRLLVVPLGVLLLGPGWAWPSRLRAMALIALGLVSYLPHLAPDPTQLSRSTVSSQFVPWLYQDTSLTPAWLTWLAALGLVLPSRAKVHYRIAVTLSAVFLFGAYWYLASEGNPRWGQWRYFVSIVPLVCLALGFTLRALFDRLRSPRFRTFSLGALVTLIAAPLAVYYPRLRAPEDQPTEFRYLLQTAPRITSRRPDVLILANRGHPPPASHVAIEGNVLFALGASSRRVSWPTACEATDGTRPSRTLRVRDLERVASDCPATIDPARSVVYLGLSREDSRLSALRARFELIAIETVTRAVSVTSTVIDKQCVPEEHGFEMFSPDAPRCTVHLGWYRLSSRN